MSQITGRKVVFIDTSVLERMIGMDGDGPARDVVAELEARVSRGDQFAIPVTTIVEAGNHIAQRAGDRRLFATRLATIIREAREANPPWIIRAATWDESFLDDMLAGDSTGSDLVSLLGDGRLGTGDLAILVERDRFERETAYVGTEVWTLDAHLGSFGAARS